MPDKKLMNETLQSAIDYNQRLISGINQYIELVEDRQTEGSFKLLSDIIEGLDWLIKAIDLSSEVQTIKMDIDLLNEHFKEIIEALENSDLLLLTDIFKYEIVEMLEKWGKGNIIN